jgi:hypothetical protein
MAGFLSGLFGRRESKATAQIRPPIGRMSFNDIAGYMGQIDGGTAVQHGGALTQRLYEIAVIWRTGYPKTSSPSLLHGRSTLISWMIFCQSCLPKLPSE